MKNQINLQRIIFRCFVRNYKNKLSSFHDLLNVLEMKNIHIDNYGKMEDLMLACKHEKFSVPSYYTDLISWQRFFKKNNI